MTFLKKISLILLSTGIISIPNYALADEMLDEFSLGMVSGSILTMCGLYHTNEVGEDRTREFIKESLKLLESWEMGHRKEEIYRLLDKGELRKCYKLLP